MAKFTVYFKDKIIESHIFDSGVVHVGRDETNDLSIDNPAIAPAHAVITVKDDHCVIKKLNDDFPVIVNGEDNKDSLLQDNDKITIGKHTIIFNTTESIAPATNNNNADKDVQSLNGKLENKLKIPDANLQVLEGQHIGRVLPLKKPMTRFGSSSSGIVVIAKRKDGYHVSSLEEKNQITINREALEDKTIKLKDNDILIIDNISMQFFLDK